MRKAAGKMKSVIIVLAFLLCIPQIIHSHVEIRDKSPSEDAVLDTPPEKIVISFFGTVEPMFSKIEVFDSDSRKVSLKTNILEDGSVMEAGFSEELGHGIYTVKWLCVSMDGHKVNGSYTFTVK